MTSEERAIIENLAEFCTTLLESEQPIERSVNTLFSSGYSDEYYSKAFLNVGKLLSEVKANRDNDLAILANALKEETI